MKVRIIQGDALAMLKTLPDESVHCIVTSPPYYGLRDYGVDGQIGLEPTPDEFIGRLVAVFREARRVLRKDGTAWVNMGDSYAGSWGNYGGQNRGNGTQREIVNGSAVPNPAYDGLESFVPPTARKMEGLKPKDLMGMPWRLAFELQADGWWLRQDIIWAKPNPMPESITDRCTKAHEYIFLLSKAERYYYDNEAIKEPAGGDPSVAKTPDGWDTSRAMGGHGSFHRDGREKGVTRSGNEERKDATERGCPNSGVDGNVPWEGTTRNKRSVWTVASAPFKDAHFATFPPKLIEPCIKAGCPIGGTVLDPFGGAGTTGLVADRLQRNAILIELNPKYAAMAQTRIERDAPLFSQVAAE